MVGPEHSGYEYDILPDGPEGGPELTPETKKELKESITSTLKELGEEHVDRLSDQELQAAIEASIVQALFYGENPRESKSASAKDIAKFNEAEAYLVHIMKELKEYGFRAITVELRPAFVDARLNYLRQNKRRYIKEDGETTFVFEGKEMTMNLPDSIFYDFGPLRESIMKKEITQAHFLEAVNERLNPVEAQTIWSYFMSGKNERGRAKTRQLQRLMFKLDPELASMLRSNSKDEDGVDGLYGMATTTAARMIAIKSRLYRLLDLDDDDSKESLDKTPNIHTTPEEEIVETKQKVTEELEQHKEEVTTQIKQETGTEKTKAPPESLVEEREENKSALETQKFVPMYDVVVFGKDLTGSMDKTTSESGVTPQEKARKRSEEALDGLANEKKKDEVVMSWFPIKDYEGDQKNGAFLDAVVGPMPLAEKKDFLTSMETDPLEDVTRQFESPLMNTLAYLKTKGIEYDVGLNKVVSIYFNEDDVGSDQEALFEIKAFAEEHKWDILLHYIDENGEEFTLNLRKITYEQAILARKEDPSFDHEVFDFTRVKAMAEDPKTMEGYAKMKYAGEYARLSAFSPKKRNFGAVKLTELQAEGDAWRAAQQEKSASR